jgi:hypothetical protein
LLLLLLLLLLWSRWRIWFLNHRKNSRSFVIVTRNEVTVVLVDGLSVKRKLSSQTEIPPFIALKNFFAFLCFQNFFLYSTCIAMRVLKLLESSFSLLAKKNDTHSSFRFAKTV